MRGLSATLAKNVQPIKAIYISSYIPRRCGVAKFTKDLTTSINNLNPHALAEIIAVSDDNHDYPWEVKLKIKQHQATSYGLAAEYIQQSSADIVNLQHEFGLFGGVHGDYILPLLDSIDKPVLTNFHSILPTPNSHQRYVMQRIIDRSDGVVAMTEASASILEQVYDCPPDKVAVIYHGVPDFKFNDIAKHKKSLNIKADPMILSCGLLGPGKGLEFVVEAMAKITQAMPNAKLYIVGQTHPTIFKEQGESYRNGLKKRIKELGITKNVAFINKYVADEDLVQYYQATDFFITAHLDPQQPMSGTLSYAMGAGRICVSTPYHYAREVLGDGSGILIDFRSSKEISDKIIAAWGDKPGLQTMRKQAYAKGRLMTWPSVGAHYLNFFRLISNEHRRLDEQQQTLNAFALANG